MLMLIPFVYFLKKLFFSVSQQEYFGHRNNITVRHRLRLLCALFLPNSFSSASKQYLYIKACTSMFSVQDVCFISLTNATEGKTGNLLIQSGFFFYFFGKSESYIYRKTTPSTCVTLTKYSPVQATVPCEQRSLTSSVLRIIHHPVNTCSMSVLTMEEE